MKEKVGIGAVLDGALAVGGLCAAGNTGDVDGGDIENVLEAPCACGRRRFGVKIFLDAIRARFSSSVS